MGKKRSKSSGVPPFGRGWVNWLVRVKLLDGVFHPALVVDFDDRAGRVLVEHRSSSFGPCSKKAEWVDAIPSHFEAVSPYKGERQLQEDSFTQLHCLMQRVPLPKPFLFYDDFFLLKKGEEDDEQVEREERKRKHRMESLAARRKRGNKRLRHSDSSTANPSSPSSSLSCSGERLSIVKDWTLKLESAERNHPDGEKFMFLDSLQVDNLLSNIAPAVSGRKLELSDCLGSVLSLETLIKFLHGERIRKLPNIKPDSSLEDLSTSNLSRFISSILSALANASQQAKTTALWTYQAQFKRSLKQAKQEKQLKKRMSKRDSTSEEDLSSSSDESDQDNEDALNSSDEEHDDLVETAMGRKGKKRLAELEPKNVYFALGGPVSQVRALVHKYLLDLTSLVGNKDFKPSSFILVEKLCRAPIETALAWLSISEADDEEEKKREGLTEQFLVYLESTWLALYHMVQLLYANAVHAVNHGTSFVLFELITDLQDGVLIGDVVERLCSYAFLFHKVSNQLKRRFPPNLSSSKKQRDAQDEIATVLAKFDPVYDRLVHLLALGVGNEVLYQAPLRAAEVEKVDDLLHILLCPTLSSSLATLFNIRLSPREAKLASIKAELVKAAANVQQDLKLLQETDDKLDNLVAFFQQMSTNAVIHKSIQCSGKDCSKVDLLVRACVITSMACSATPLCETNKPQSLSTPVRKSVVKTSSRRPLRSSRRLRENNAEAPMEINAEIPEEPELALTPSPIRSTTSSEMSIETKSTCSVNLAKRMSRLCLVPFSDKSKHANKENVAPEIHFTENKLSVGRSKECALRFGGKRSDAQLLCLSRVHAELSCSNTSHLLPKCMLKVFSSNGVTVNGNMVQKNEEKSLKPGDVINFCLKQGPRDFRYELCMVPA